MANRNGNTKAQLNLDLGQLHDLIDTKIANALEHAHSHSERKVQVMENAVEEKDKQNKYLIEKTADMARKLNAMNVYHDRRVDELISSRNDKIRECRYLRESMQADRSFIKRIQQALCDGSASRHEIIGWIQEHRVQEWGLIRESK